MPHPTRVLTLTLHPAIDRVVRVDKLVPGATFNGREELRVPAGKGVNTARVLKALSPDVNVAAAVWLGGGEWAFFEDWLAENGGIHAEICARECATRIATTYIEKHGRETHIKETMNPPAAAEERALLAFWRGTVQPGDAVAICGSAPQGTSEKTLRAVLRAAHESGAECIVVDSNGALLRCAAESSIAVLKCNVAEVSELLESKRTLDLFSKPQRTRVHAFLKRRGAPKCALVTAGAAGAFLFDGSGAHYLSPPRVRRKPVAVTGCGDAATAGVLLNLLHGSPAAGQTVRKAHMLEQAVALGTAKMFSLDPGGLDTALAWDAYSRRKDRPVAL
jgi:fructose-1-phosphate kinase PfkB-like protein